MMDRIKREPVLLSVLGGNLIALAVVFGLNLSTEQTAAIMGLLSTITTIVFGRSNATPTADVVVQREGDIAVAGPASIYPDGVQMETVPSSLTHGMQLALLVGKLKPKDVIVRNRITSPPTPILPTEVPLAPEDGSSAIPTKE